MSERDDAALVGTVLQESYRLSRLIGAGGMGAVYEGVHLRLNKRVAVKLMMKELAASQEALARFRREAEVTSHLGHPHIVNVFDFGTTPSGASYLVMEYLEGEDLDHRLRRTGKQSLASTAHVVKQVASALAATHAKGVVHRDLKPANLFVLEVEGENDFIKVVDFGISKVRAATTKLTGASAVMGTPNYMSPEQARGLIDEIDHRTDQWSLACIAYEMLTGRGPFVGESAASLLYQVIHEEPPPLEARAPGLPKEVERVIRRGLAKNMDGRYPNITEFARAFERAAEGAAAARPEKERAPAADTGSHEKPRGQPTTFSNTASELIPPERTWGSKTRSRLLALGAGGVCAVGLALVLTHRSASKVEVSAAPRSESVPVPAAAAAPPAPQVAPPAPPPAVPPQRASGAEAAPAQAALAKEPKPALPSKGDSATAPSAHKAGAMRSLGSPEREARAKAAASSGPAKGTSKAKWVDPFEQEEGRPSKPAVPDQGVKRPDRPKRRILEDL
jgi:serine/threonine-protein kinase